MIKAGVSHLRELQQCYCTFKGEDATLRDDRALIWKCCLLPGWDQRRPGRCVLSCCSEWSDQRGGGEVSWRTDSLGCVCQFFFFFPWTNLAHAKKGLCNCQDYSFGLLYIISQILQMVSCSRQIWDNYQGYNKTQGTTQSVPTIQVLLVTCSCMNFSVSLTTGVTDEAPLTSLRIRFSPPLLVPRGENIV